MTTKQRIYKPHKVNYINSFKTALADYTKILFVNADNVGSRQMAKIRLKMRETNSILLMGKNTLMKTAIKQGMKKKPKIKNTFRPSCWKLWISIYKRRFKED